MKSPEATRPSFFKMSLRWSGLLNAAGALAGFGTIAGFMGKCGWIFDLFSHFRVQYFVGLCILAAASWSLRSRKMSVVFGSPALVNLLTILPLYFPQSGSAQSGSRTYRVLLSNVNTETGDPRRVSEMIRKYDPDFIVLEEVNVGWLAALRPIIKRYPFQQLEPRDDNFGIALLSRFQFTQCETLRSGEAELPSIIAKIPTEKGDLSIVATHPLPPVNAEQLNLRNEQFVTISKRIREAGSSVVLVGDLNTSPWSPYFRQLLVNSGLRDSSQGFGIQPTWPTGSLLMRIPLDHCLSSSNIRIVSKETGPDVGSDHFPIIVDFQIGKP